jgi:hypothetical protein
MLAMRACTNQCKSGEYEVGSQVRYRDWPLPGLYGAVLAAVLASPWTSAETAEGWFSTLNVSCNPHLRTRTALPGHESRLESNWRCASIHTGYLMGAPVSSF